jgi:uroporphyrinogen decarboxylase
MNSRERIRTIIAGGEPDRCGFWLGNPYPDTWPLLFGHFGVPDDESLRRKLHDDYRWINPDADYAGPGGRTMWHIDKKAHGAAGPLAQAETVADVEAFDWPRLEYLNYEPTLARLRGLGEVYRASGYWTPFYHIVMDLFGMDTYMMNMYLNKKVVHAVTDQVCQFFYEANELFFAQAGDLVDGYFFGNDFGTQRDLICGPKQFDEFIMPWFERFTAQGHRWGKQVILHSCGAIHKVIERLIAAGVDCLHPLQALAEQMDAETLARDFKGRIAFLGGIDTQLLLDRGTPDEVRAEVRRVRDLLGPNVIISPSHEAILPNVPLENIRAMAEEATGMRVE